MTNTCWLWSLYNSVFPVCFYTFWTFPLWIFFFLLKIASIITFGFPISKTDSIPKMPFLLRSFYKFLSLSMNDCSKKIESNHILPKIKSFHWFHIIYQSIPAVETWVGTADRILILNSLVCGWRGRAGACSCPHACWARLEVASGLGCSFIAKSNHFVTVCLINFDFSL